jgi:hypothetical protein
MSNAIVPKSDQRLALPSAALSDQPELSGTWQSFKPPTQPFCESDPFHQLTFPSVLDAKRAIATTSA